MRKLLVALLSVGALSLGMLATPAPADPPPQACHGAVVSNGVQVFGPGRRAVAERFFGDYPQAVQDAERFLETVICA
jgi:hypothetical protein